MDYLRRDSDTVGVVRAANQILRGGSSVDLKLARRPVVAQRTGRKQVSSIPGKAQLANHTQAKLYALREGLASLDETP